MLSFFFPCPAFHLFILFLSFFFLHFSSLKDNFLSLRLFLKKHAVQSFTTYEEATHPGVIAGNVCPFTDKRKMVICGSG